MSFSLSVIIPVYNDQEVLNELFQRLSSVLPSITFDYEVILVDDGSKDNSWMMIANFAKKTKSFKGVKLVRNFGQQNAITCGLELSKKDIVIIMDSDLQDKPEDIPKLINALNKSDANMAIAQWKSREDSWFKKKISKFFFKVSNKLTNINHKPNLGVFRAIRREVLDELKNYPEKTSTTLSLLYWIGADYVVVPLNRDGRFAGKSGYNLTKMIKLSMDRIFSFSMAPIRFSIYLGLIISISSFILAFYFIIKFFFYDVAPGWTSISVLVLFLFGVNFLFIGIIGEYLGRIFLESKSRPKYVISKIVYE